VARIKPESVEAVKAAADIVAIVEVRTRLRKVGAGYKGLCPFHEEKTPSFSVLPDKGSYHCFGCGVGGDAISFVQETEGLDFVGAIEWLADRFRVPLEYEEVSPQVDAERRRRERLYALLEQAASFYERLLWESKAGEAAREYLESRGLGAEICKEFRLGLSATGATLAKKAREKEFTQAELAAAGLVTRRGTDYFQRRLMFPLADRGGRVIAFQARKLHEDDPLKGKYVNSPESELFHKSQVLYGLHLARREIAKQARAIVVEGNPDVIALRQTGLEPVVASMGTALTEAQLRELGRLARRVYLCFDADAAGEAATLRGMDLAVAQGLEVKVVPLPPGQDPADAADRFEDRLAQAVPYALYRVQTELAQAPDAQAAYQRVTQVLDLIPDSPDRQEAWRYANDRLGMTIQIQRGTTASTTATVGAISPKLLEAGERLERDALAGCVRNSSLASYLAELSAEHFDSEPHRAIRSRLVSGAEPDRELLPLLAELDAVAAAEEIDEATTKELLLRLRVRYLRRQLAAEPERNDLREALARVLEAAGSFA
jgi:DNA primase